MTTNTALVGKILVIVAVVCFVIAFLMASGTVDNGNPSAWGYFGLAALAAGLVP